MLCSLGVMAARSTRSEPQARTVHRARVLSSAAARRTARCCDLMAGAFRREAGRTWKSGHRPRWTDNQLPSGALRQSMDRSYQYTVELSLQPSGRTLPERRASRRGVSTTRSTRAKRSAPENPSVFVGQARDVQGRLGHAQSWAESSARSSGRRQTSSGFARLFVAYRACHRRHRGVNSILVQLKGI